MKTCNKIQTANGPLFRKGGLGIIHQGVAQLGILTQVYKSSLGVYYAVVEKLRDVTAEKRDPFLKWLPLQDQGASATPESSAYRFGDAAFERSIRGEIKPD